MAWQWRQAKTNERATRTEASKSEQVARFRTDMLKGVGPSVALGRDTKMLKEILDKTAERVSKDLTNQPEVEAQLRMTSTQEAFPGTRPPARQHLRIQILCKWKSIVT